MRAAPLLLGAALAVLVAAPLRAQHKPSAEIGTSLGVTVLSQSGTTLTTIGVPVPQGPTPVFGQAAMYATIFATPSLMVEPQVSFAHVTDGNSSITVIGVAGQTGYLFTPARPASPYVAANVGFQHLGGDVGSGTGVGIGGAVGYRLRVGAGFAVRFEARYRRWLGDFDGLNEFGFGIGLGGII